MTQRVLRVDVLVNELDGRMQDYDWFGSCETIPAGTVVQVFPPTRPDGLLMGQYSLELGHRDVVYLTAARMDRIF